VATKLTTQCRFCSSVVGADDARCAHCGKRLRPLRTDDAAPAKWSPADEWKAAEARKEAARAAIVAAAPAPPASTKKKRMSPSARRIGLRLGVVAVLAVVGYAVKGNGPSIPSLDGKCVTMTGVVGSRNLKQVPCGETHSGKVVAVVSQGGTCPDAADDTFTAKKDTSKTLCIDLDQ
jgi:hypothetical protein